MPTSMGRGAGVVKRGCRRSAVLSPSNVAFPAYGFLPPPPMPKAQPAGTSRSSMPPSRHPTGWRSSGMARGLSRFCHEGTAARLMHLSSSTLQLAASDLGRFLSCRHCTALDMDVAQGLRPKPPVYPDPFLDLLIERGMAHEKEYAGAISTAGDEVH